MLLGGRCWDGWMNGGGMSNWGGVILVWVYVERVAV